MKKSSSAALFAVALLGMLPALGCNGADANVENVEVDKKAWGDKPIDPNRLVDSVESWRKFMAEAKQPERMKLAEQKFTDQVGPAADVKVVFMKDGIEYIKFGDKSDFKGIDPNRLYEMGVVTLAAKENWGAEGYQIREYSLKFITPQRDGDWKYLYGTYRVTKFTVSRSADPMTVRMVDEKEYQKSYLRNLFTKPLPASKPAGGTTEIQTGGETPVETNIKP